MKRSKYSQHFLRHQADTLSDRELLTTLLQYCDSAPEETAEKLLNRYGNLANLLEAKTSDLRAYTALNEESLALLCLVTELRRKYLMIRCRTERFLRDSNAYAQYLMPYFSGENEEMVYLLCLDEEGKPLSCERVAQGTVDSANISPRLLVRIALQCGAYAVVLAHNHPSGFFTPSNADISVSQRLAELLRPLDIRMLDHIIFSNDIALSLRDSHYCDCFF